MRRALSIGESAPGRNCFALPGNPQSEVQATQFTMKWAERPAWLSFDFLGLKTLTVIDRCRALLRQDRLSGSRPDSVRISLIAYKPLAKGLTAGVFSWKVQACGMRLRKQTRLH